MMLLRCRIFIRLALGIVAAESVALGCSCAKAALPCIAFANSDVIFLGTVVGMGKGQRQLHSGERTLDISTVKISFQVEEKFKGIDVDHIDVQTGLGGGDCGFPFHMGRTYLVYADQDVESGALETSFCSRTAPLVPFPLMDSIGVTFAYNDLAYLRSPAPRSERRVFGYVSNELLGWGDRIRRLHISPVETPPAEGVARVAVWLKSDTYRRKVLTDSKGRFSFENVPAGNYLCFHCEAVTEGYGEHIPDGGGSDARMCLSSVFPETSACRVCD